MNLTELFLDMRYSGHDPRGGGRQTRTDDVPAAASSEFDLNITVTVTSSTTILPSV